MKGIVRRLFDIRFVEFHAVHEYAASTAIAARVSVIVVVRPDLYCLASDSYYSLDSKGLAPKPRPDRYKIATLWTAKHLADHYSVAGIESGQHFISFHAKRE